jgi:hypothetical protein
VCAILLNFYDIVEIVNVFTVGHIILEQVQEVEWLFHHLLQKYWYEHNFLTPQWWLLVILSIISPIIWWKLVDRRKLFENATFGLVLGMMVIILDSIGGNACYGVIQFV